MLLDNKPGLMSKCGTVALYVCHAISAYRKNIPHVNYESLLEDGLIMLNSLIAEAGHDFDPSIPSSMENLTIYASLEKTLNKHFGEFKNHKDKLDHLKSIIIDFMENLEHIVKKSEEADKVYNFFNDIKTELKNERISEEYNYKRILEERRFMF